VGLCIFIMVRSGIHQYGMVQFERGAWAIVKYHSVYGNYGSMYYRQRVFESGEDPQDSLDIVRLMSAESKLRNANTQR
jgi:hypothetical protein